MVLGEGRLGETLAGAGDGEIRVADAEPLLPPWGETLRGKVGRPEVVGIEIGGYVYALVPRILEHLERLRHGEGPTGAGDVENVHRSPRIAARADYLVQRVEVSPGLFRVRVSAVEEGGNPILGRHPGHLHDLLVADSGSVLRRELDSYEPLFDAFLGGGRELVDLRLRCLVSDTEVQAFGIRTDPVVVESAAEVRW